MLPHLKIKISRVSCLHISTFIFLFLSFLTADKGLSIYYVSSYNKAGSVGMLTNAYLREQGFIQKLMSYENPH